MVRKPLSVTSSKQSVSVPAAAVMSFLKETRGMLTWTVKDLQKTLLITSAEARQVIAVLELQGYVKHAQKPEEWLTTLNGESVSGSKPPRFKRESVEQALASLQERIKSMNKDSSSPYTATSAAAFGDFLAGRAQVQAADVGLQLASRKSQRGQAEFAKEGMRKRDFLKKLRARDVKLNLVLYEAWMRERSHRSLLASQD